jgi:hypothetical protein
MSSLVQDLRDLCAMNAEGGLTDEEFKSAKEKVLEIHTIETTQDTLPIITTCLGNPSVYKHTLHKGCDANSGRTERPKQHLAKEVEIRQFTLDEARQMSIDYMNENDDIKGFSLNTKVCRPWFHKDIKQSRIRQASDYPLQKNIEWFELHIK